MQKRLNVNAENTSKANRKCANILRDYLQEKEQDDDFEKFDCVRLNETLCHFYVDLRKGDGERYKASSLESIRHGINRYLKAPPHSKDELTKNHRESDKELVSGVMPESPGSVYCPVASYENYIRRLHPSNDRLWQKPLDSFSTEADVWYCNMPLGEKTKYIYVRTQ
ncbi:unnamed protein product [Mytilus edulis]|uniref:Uncharacterized protein n=1 Tax=Mytilus edulis TaxID=6550 RepID=A0A8S3RMW8_MYTED|nr:unnamed protein product [Mytilus edulis]